MRGGRNWGTRGGRHRSGVSLVEISHMGVAGEYKMPEMYSYIVINVLVHAPNNVRRIMFHHYGPGGKKKHIGSRGGKKK